ncbi:MAG TPA: hypothetical protein VKV40_17235 [Ktedonobacteraceae bacterium]|nr:hypothetical protein [Ktedonobacteraceae bacterium]
MLSPPAHSITIPAPSHKIHLDPIFQQMRQQCLLLARLYLAHTDRPPIALGRKAESHSSPDCLNAQPLPDAKSTLLNTAGTTD